MSISFIFWNVGFEVCREEQHPPSILIGYQRFLLFPPFVNSAAVEWNPPEAEGGQGVKAEKGSLNYRYLSKSGWAVDGVGARAPSVEKLEHCIQFATLGAGKSWLLPRWHFYVYRLEGGNISLPPPPPSSPPSALLAALPPSTRPSSRVSRNILSSYVSISKLSSRRISICMLHIHQAAHGLEIWIMAFRWLHHQGRCYLTISYRFWWAVGGARGGGGRSQKGCHRRVNVVLLWAVLIDGMMRWIEQLSREMEAGMQMRPG